MQFFFPPDLDLSFVQPQKPVESIIIIYDLLRIKWKWYSAEYEYVKCVNANLTDFH